MIHHLQHIVDLVEICRIKGIRQVVVSPGSRNAALIKLFASNRTFSLHSIVDERAAAFYGLGIALATGEPVALLCTSGTAVLNYAPALAEAYYQRVPLVALTADRPENLIDQQDNQTIRQANVYQNYIKESVHLHQPIKDAFELQLQHQAISKAIDCAQTGIIGPVHINIPIAEPFYIDLPQPSDKILIIGSENNISKNYTGLFEAWNKAKRPLIICGEGAINENLNKYVNQLAEKAIVLAEPISNIKGEKIISIVDRLMMQIETANDQNFQPDLLISFGGPVVSKRLKQWLQKQPELLHYRISEDIDKIDTYQNLTETITGNVVETLYKLSKLSTSTDPNFLSFWQQQYEINQNIHTQIIDNIPYSDLLVFHTILQNLPQHCYLHLGNSSPVRYAQLFDLSLCIGVFSNRGVSGIDGCLSTAAGFASQTKQTNVLLTGDLSFLYDSNGLWNSRLSPQLKIIVINNKGGGIFRMIPGPTKMDTFEEFMETKHPVDVEKLVSAFGVSYSKCEAKDELSEKIHQFLQSKSGPALLEIKTPRLENAEIYKQYIQQIKNL